MSLNSVDSFSCPICTKALTDPLILSCCGESICAQCDRWFAVSSKGDGDPFERNCPVCKKPRAFNIFGQRTENVTLKRLLLQLHQENVHQEKPKDDWTTARIPLIGHNLDLDLELNLAATALVAISTLLYAIAGGINGAPNDTKNAIEVEIAMTLAYVLIVVASIVALLSIIVRDSALLLPLIVVLVSFLLLNSCELFSSLVRSHRVVTGTCHYEMSSIYQAVYVALSKDGLGRTVKRHSERKTVQDGLFIQNRDSNAHHHFTSSFLQYTDARESDARAANMQPRNTNDYYCCGHIHVKTPAAIVAVIGLAVSLLKFAYLGCKVFTPDDPTPWFINTIDFMIVWVAVFSCCYALLAVVSNESGFLRPLMLIQLVDMVFSVIKMMLYQQALEDLRKLLLLLGNFTDEELHAYSAVAYFVYILGATVCLVLTYNSHRYLKRIECGPCAQDTDRSPGGSIEIKNI
ncbi:hypothetical protein QR680_004122 [Steinernema hermaphroditum]|uniref:RING-type domain-containing protein n=1 Tax=Steinernema hermaphroditum TaxID=289476 RepID=A0AA39LSP7_9BILA|nr:hypothetical protein QR680_004122 [Steinernema hermaphroditum]